MAQENSTETKQLISGLIDREKPIRREVLFFLVMFVAVFAGSWVWATGYKSFLAGDNPNLFHEWLATFLLIWFSVWCYFKLYLTSDSYVEKQAAIEAAQKAAIAKAKAAEQARKDKAFMKIVIGFESAKTFEDRVRVMGDLLAVGIESPSLRQRTVDALIAMNQWMVANKIYLRTQNLIAWRLKNELFEVSTRFQENAETQDASIKVINIIETIIKKHLEEFIAGHNKNTLDISKHCLPTLNLSAKEIPPGSIKIEDGDFWQSAFSESNLEGISFRGSDLYGSSFWRAGLTNIDFQDVILEHGKLRTNLQLVKNLSPEQFFATKEWELCLLNKAQEKLYFGEPPEEDDVNYRKWNNAKIRRDKLYFGIDQI